MPDLVQNAVGEKIYVWTKRQGKPSPEAQGRCIITSHGAQSLVNSKFPVKDAKLIFYCPHGQNLLDPRTENVMKGDKRPVEEIASGECQDYVLSKFTREGQGGEDYKTIAEMGDRIEGLTQGWVVGMAEAAKKGEKEAFMQAALTLGRLPGWMDIVTIRNRPLKFTPTVSEVIKTLHEAGYNYTEIHCVFCRGPQLPWLSAPDYKPEWQKA